MRKPNYLSECWQKGDEAVIQSYAASAVPWTLGLDATSKRYNSI